MDFVIFDAHLNIRSSTSANDVEHAMRIAKLRYALRGPIVQELCEFHNQVNSIMAKGFRNPWHNRVGAFDNHGIYSVDWKKMNKGVK